MSAIWIKSGHVSGIIGEYTYVETVRTAVGIRIHFRHNEPDRDGLTIHLERDSFLESQDGDIREGLLELEGLAPSLRGDGIERKTSNIFDKY